MGIVSLVLVSYSDGRLPDQKTLLLALFGGLGFGAFLLLIHRVESQAIFWPQVAARAVSSFRAVGDHRTVTPAGMATAR